MICGNGMLAQYFRTIDQDDLIFFCSGASDHLNVDFTREEEFLFSLPTNKIMIYTSSVAAKLSMTPYQKHKLNMESRVCSLFPKCLIFRVGNLVGVGQNPKQFFPSIVEQVKNKKVNIANVKRDLLLVHDYVAIVKDVLKDNRKRLLSLCSLSPPFVSQIVDEIEIYVGAGSQRIESKINEPDVYQPDLIVGGIDYYKMVVKQYFEGNI